MMEEIILRVVIFSMLNYSSQAALSYTDVTISNGGYTGLVIAIHPDVQEDDNLIDAIKKTWTDASKDLYIATGSRAYFKQITILLPKTWNGFGYGSATGNEKYDLADVVVAPPDESYGNEPYTTQYGECGTMGIRTQYTPAYLLDDEFVQNYGPRGKVVMHEWAHYRWGVFDETSEDYPFYWEDTAYASDYGPSPTTCPNGLRGQVLNVQSGYRPCGLSDIDMTTNTYPYYCVFFPDEVQNHNINTSLMAYQYLENVITFCRDEEDGAADAYNIHNTEAPNSQNRLCSMRSIWSIIKESPDFQSWNNSDLNNITETVPQFSIVTNQEHQRFVLVLDMSGSMSSPCGSVTRLDCLTTAAYQFITVTAPNNSYIGIVYFSTTANTLEPLTLINSPQSRDQLAESLTWLISGGSTCIGCGIETAITELEANGTSAAGGQLIVITDGQENEPPYVANVAPEVLQKGVVVTTVFISTDANQDLKTLSEESGGQTYLATDQQDLQEIFSSVAITDSADDNKHQIYSSSFYLNNTSMFTSSFNIDKTVGLDTVLTFTWSIGNIPPDIKIRSPSNCYYANYKLSGAECDGGNTSYTESGTFMTIQFNIPGIAEVGRWIYTVLSGYDVGLMTCSVTSAASSESVSSIQIQSGMGQTEISQGAATVYSIVTQGSSPILNAIVTATVTGPSGITYTVDLYDNGAGADIRLNDGIYSRYFTEFTGPGRYSVDINVENGPMKSATAREKQSHANYSPGYISPDGKPNVNPNGPISQEGSGTAGSGIQSSSLGDFTRVVPSGSFDYTGPVNVTNPYAPDVYPPSRIIDAQLKQNDLEDVTKGLILQFTAPGDDYDSGTASGYEIRYSFGNFTNLNRNFNSNTLLLQSDLSSGNLSKPLPAGSKENITVVNIDLPKDKNGNPIPSTYVGMAIVAFDETPNYAQPSNVPVINVFVEPIKFPGTGQQEIWWIILLSVILALIVVVGAAVGFYKWSRSRKHRDSRRRQQVLANNQAVNYAPKQDNFSDKKRPPPPPRDGNAYATGQEYPPPVLPRDYEPEYTNTRSGQSQNDLGNVSSVQPYPYMTEYQKRGSEVYAEIQDTAHHNATDVGTGHHNGGYLNEASRSNPPNAFHIGVVNELKARNSAYGKHQMERWG